MGAWGARPIIEAVTSWLRGRRGAFTVWMKAVLPDDIVLIYGGHNRGW